MKLKVKQGTLGILAIFVMFMPRRLSIFGMFSFRLFIILALALVFSLLLIYP